jgi:carbamoyl-phosphate synthase large subunit
VDYIKSGKVDLIINTPLGRESFFDEKAIRRAAITHRVPCITTIPGAAAAVNGIRAIRRESLNVKSIQEYHASLRGH